MFLATVITKLVITSAIIFPFGSAISFNRFQSQSLNAHNKYRSKHHVAGVRWSQSLANHATRVSRYCDFKHHVLPGTGQNIARGYPSMKAVVDAWYNEVKYYNYKTGYSRYSNRDVDHFTQITWKGTKEVGCGSTYCPNFKQTYYVCDYNPPGNYNHANSANVLRP